MAPWPRRFVQRGIVTPGTGKFITIQYYTCSALFSIVSTIQTAQMQVDIPFFVGKQYEILAQGVIPTASQAITCQANVPGAGEDGRGYPEAPEGMDLSQICGETCWCYGDVGIVGMV